MVVQRVRLAGKDIAIEGCSGLPQLARLSREDQVFFTAFVRCHGSIKEMEQIFGVSYPTIKSRLNRISQSLEFVETNPAPPRSEILEQLSRGDIRAEDAIRELEARKRSPSPPRSTSGITSVPLCSSGFPWRCCGFCCCRCS
jgi:hypothetical protein